MGERWCGWCGEVGGLGNYVSPRGLCENCAIRCTPIQITTLSPTDTTLAQQYALVASLMTKLK